MSTQAAVGSLSYADPHLATSSIAGPSVQQDHPGDYLLHLSKEDVEWLIDNSEGLTRVFDDDLLQQYNLRFKDRSLSSVAVL